MRSEDGWLTLSTKTHFANAHLKVVDVEMRTPAHPKPRSWTIVHRKAAVVIAPMTRDGKLVLIRQERLPIREQIWEMPAGQIDDDDVAGIADPGHSSPHPSIEAVALRELREETGWELAEDGQLIPLGHYFTSPGFTDERGHFFLARLVQAGAAGHAHDASESILDCRSFSPDELSRMIRENEIRDANTLSICARLIACGYLTLTPNAVAPPTRLRGPSARPARRRLQPPASL
jgi:ADP-ribose pyrophosphatase